MNSKVKGVLAALGASLGYSLVYILAKFAQREVSTENFLFWWFLLASLWATVIIVGKKEGYKNLWWNFRNHILFFLYFGFSEAFATFLFFYLVKILNPSFVAFIVNLQPLLVIFWGYILISERLNLYEFLGGGIAIFGTVLLTYAEGDINTIHIFLLLIMIAVYSLNTVLIRTKVQGISPIFFTVFRVYTLFILFSFLVLPSGRLKIPSTFAFLNIAAGSLLGPVLATTSVFVALKYLKAANVSIIKNIQPFIVLLLSYALLHQGLHKSQILGGILIVIGINILVLGNRRSIHKAFSRGKSFN